MGIVRITWGGEALSNKDSGYLLESVQIIFRPYIAQYGEYFDTINRRVGMITSPKGRRLWTLVRLCKPQRDVVRHACQGT